MKRRYWIVFAAILAATAGTVLRGSIRPTPPTVPPAPPQPEVTYVMEVRPGVVFPGDFATAYGFHLDAAHVKQLWLVEGKATFRLEIVEQREHSILFRLPTWIPAGQWQVAVLTEHEMLIEQGAYVTVRPARGVPTG